MADNTEALPLGDLTNTVPENSSEEITPATTQVQNQP